VNLQNLFDTHTTTEVWLPGSQRWVLLDATFGGYLTEGKSGRKLGAFELSALVRRRAAGNVYWHAIRSRYSELPSANYIDLLDYFSYVGIFPWDDGRAIGPVTNADAASLGGLVSLSPLNDRNGPSALRYRDDLHPAPPSSLSFARAPWWAPTLLARTRQSDLQLGSLRYVVVSVASKAAPTVNGYSTTPLNGRWTTPVIAATEIHVVGADAGSRVRVYGSHSFPHSRELG
jgi:hypothetical protein